jgi:hypothetical protein
VNNLAAFSQQLRLSAQSSSLIGTKTLLTLSLALALSAVFYALLRLIRLHAEVSRLKYAARFIARKEIIPQQLRFHCPNVASVWQSLLALSSHRRSLENIMPAYEELISLGNRIEGASDEPHALAREIINVVLAQCHPEAIGAAVLLRNQHSGEMELVQYCGPSAKRVAKLLIPAFEELADRQHSANPSSWGYRLSHQSPMWDFSTFGIGLSFTAPFKDQDGICGGIWLGFRSESATLSAQRKSFVQGVAQHAAATFATARKVEAKT